MWVVLIDFLGKFIRRGLVLALIGHLFGVTSIYKHKAAESLQKGLINLKSINEQLVGPQH